MIVFVILNLIIKITVSFSIVIIALFIICAVLTKRISKGYNELTPKGMEEREQWRGLKKYMEDFSKLDERHAPEVVLWEKYLVYATVFGIAEKVLNQLKVTYPELTEDFLNNSTYLGIAYNSNLSSGFIYNLETSTSAAYFSGVSSAEGYGGGFSGGGGAGGGGRWPEEVDNLHDIKYYIFNFWFCYINKRSRCFR